MLAEICFPDGVHSSCKEEVHRSTKVFLMYFDLKLFINKIEKIFF